MVAESTLQWYREHRAELEREVRRLSRLPVPPPATGRLWRLQNWSSWDVHCVEDNAALIALVSEEPELIEDTELASHCIRAVGVVYPVQIADTAPRSTSALFRVVAEDPLRLIRALCTAARCPQPQQPPSANHVIFSTKTTSANANPSPAQLEVSMAKKTRRGTGGRRRSKKP